MEEFIMTMYPDYLPVDPDFTARLEQLAETDRAFSDADHSEADHKLLSVSFFDSSGAVRAISGRAIGITSPDGFVQFLSLEGHSPVRLDRIITLNGLPAPAYDEYDSYALACLTCMGGMD